MLCCRRVGCPFGGVVPLLVIDARCGGVMLSRIVNAFYLGSLGSLDAMGSRPMSPHIEVHVIILCAADQPGSFVRIRDSEQVMRGLWKRGHARPA